MDSPTLLTKYNDCMERALARSPANATSVALEGIGLILSGLDSLILLTTQNQVSLEIQTNLLKILTKEVQDG